MTHFSAHKHLSAYIFASVSKMLIVWRFSVFSLSLSFVLQQRPSDASRGYLYVCLALHTLPAVPFIALNADTSTCLWSQQTPFSLSCTCLSFIFSFDSEFDSSVTFPPLLSHLNSSPPRSFLYHFSALFPYRSCNSLITHSIEGNKIDRKLIEMF